MPRQGSNKLRFSVLFEQGIKQLELQSASVESMEAKTVSLMAGEGVVLTILVTFATQTKDFAANYEMYIGVGLLLVSLFCCVITLLDRHLKAGLGIRDFYDRYYSDHDDIIRINALNILNYDFEVNRIRIQNKSRWFTAAIVLFGISLLFLVWGLLQNYITWYTHDMKHNQSQPIKIQPTQQKNSNKTIQPSLAVNHNHVFKWSSPNQNLGTIAADVIRSNQDYINR